MMNDEIQNVAACDQLKAHLVDGHMGKVLEAVVLLGVEQATAKYGEKVVHSVLRSAATVIWNESKAGA